MTILTFFGEQGSKPVVFSASKHLIIFGTFLLCCLRVSILLGLRFVSDTDAGPASELMLCILKEKAIDVP